MGSYCVQSGVAFMSHGFILQNLTFARDRKWCRFKKKELFWLVSATAVSQQNFPEEMHGDSIATSWDLCYILHAVAVFSWENPAIPHCPHSHGVCAVQPDCAWQMAAAATGHWLCRGIFSIVNNPPSCGFLLLFSWWGQHKACSVVWRVDKPLSHSLGNNLFTNLSFCGMQILALGTLPELCAPSSGAGY